MSRTKRTSGPLYITTETRPIIEPAMPPLDGRHACASYHQTRRAPLIRALLRLKFDGIKGALDADGALAMAMDIAPVLAHHLQAAGWVGYIVPVPSSPERLAKRGYNQAERLARALAAMAHMPLLDCLRTQARASQLSMATADERRANAAGRIWSMERLPGYAIIIDDMATTGATLTEAARALKAAGAYRAYGLTVASATTHQKPK